MNGAPADNPDDVPDELGVSAYRARTRWSWWRATALVAIALAAAAVLAQGAIALMAAAGINAIYWQVLAALAVSQVTCIVLIWWAAGLFGNRREQLLALGPPAQGARSYVFAYLAMVVIFGSLSALMWMLEPDRVIGDLTVYAGLIRSPAWWLAVVVIVVGAPVMEELMFRGFLFPALARSRLGIGGAAAVTSASWAALHAGYSVAGLLEVFLIGLYFAWLLVKTGSLRVPMFCHATYNLSALVLLMAVDIPVAAPG